MHSTIRVAAITVSDTRTPENDEGGDRLRERLEAAGFTVSLRIIVPDDPDEVRAVIARVCDGDLADAIVTTGGTGIAPATAPTRRSTSSSRRSSTALERRSAASPGTR